MASSDLDHLKISYRTRFCCTSRLPVTDLWQGQNLLENIQDCFEEKSYDTGFSTNPGSPTLCSTPCKLRNDSYSSPNKECQISPSKTDCVSSVKKKAKTSVLSHQTIMLQSQGNNSVLPPEIPQKLSQADLVDLKNTPNLKYASSGAEEFNKIPNEVVEEFYLTVGSPGLLAKETEILPLPKQATPTAHDRWNHKFGNSVNQQPSLPTSSLKTKKSLNYEDITVWSAVKTAEKDIKLSERRQKRIQSESEKGSQDTKQKIQQRAKTNFSTLLLEAAKGNCRNSSVHRHVSPPQTYSPSPLPNDLESSNDEFIIDESDCSASQSWILIPNKNSKSVKPGKTDPVKSSQDSERKKSGTEQQQGEKCSSSSDKHLNTEKEISNIVSEERTSKSIKHKARAVEKSQPSKRKKLDSLSNEMGSTSKSTRHKIYSEKSEQFLENKGAIVEHQSEKCETQIDNRESVEGLFNCAENQDSFHSEQNIAEVHTTLRTTKSKTASVEKSQTIEISKLRKCQKKDYKPQVSVKHHGTEQTKKKRSNMSQRNQDKLHRESDRILGQQKERAESCHSAEQILSADVSGKQKKNNSASQQVQKKGHLKKTSNKNEQMPKKRESLLKQNKSQDFTVTRSQRISKRPSTWWVVTTEQSNMSSSPTLELPVNHKKASRPSKETKKISVKTLGKGTIPLKRQKSSINAKSKAASIPNKRKGRRLSYSSDENCDMVHMIPNIDEQEGSLKETPKVACSSTAEPSEECIGAAQNVNLTPTILTGDSKISVTSAMEESGPTRLRNNVLTSRFNKISGDEQECGTNTNGFTVSGTISNDRVSPKQKSNRKRERVNTDSCEDEQKKKAIASLDISLGDPSKPTCVFDPGREQMVFKELVKIKGTHEFCVQDDTLKMFKILNTSMFATGTLILEPFKEKGKQYVCSDTVVFFVVSGNLLCTLHETNYNLNSGDTFYVPSGNFYNIKNLIDERSILLFTQIKTERPEK
uniref:Centromere protein C n=1 Tax=Monodelphis domestica TaxID=13616 RepID=A0A5F8GRN3_MONDO